MDVIRTLFGFIGATLFALNLYYCGRILRQLSVREEETLAKFFLKPKVAWAFKFLAVSAMIFAAGMFLAGMALLYDHAVLDYASKVGSLVFFFGLVYFFRTVATATAR